MGILFSKSDALDFAVLPSKNVEGPLGLGRFVSYVAYGRFRFS